MITSPGNRAILFAIVLLLALPAGGQEVKRDPKVQAIFDQMVAACKAATTLQEKVMFKFVPDAAEYSPQGQGVSMEIKVQKPNKMNLTYIEKIFQVTTAGGKEVKTPKVIRHQVVSDGAWVYRWQSDKNTYTKTKSGATFPDLPSTLVLPDLEQLTRGKDPFKDLPIPGNLLTAGAPVKIGEQMMDVIEGKLNDPGVTYIGRLRMLFSQKDHTFRGMVFEGESKIAAQGKAFSFHIEAAYDQVLLGPTFTADDFKFTPPAGAQLEQAGAAGGNN